MRNRLLFSILLIFSSIAQAVDSSVDAALASIRDGARASKSDAVLVMRGADVLLEEYRDPDETYFELMSVTKSVVALAIGALLTDGKLTSIDAPVADFYPEWKQGRKAQITIRMLMNHTSGLQDNPNASVEVYPAPDFVQLALAAELTTDPGTTFFYNNKAMNLLAGIVQKASDQSMDAYLLDRLFTPMAIKPGPWMKDRAGNPHSMAGLPLTARDLAKIGRLVLDHGRYAGRRLIAEAFIDDMLRPSPHLDRYGLLWWRVPESQRYHVDAQSFQMLTDAGVDAEMVAALRPLEGKVYNSGSALYQELTAALGSDGDETWQTKAVAKGVRMSQVFHLQIGPVVAYEGNGYLGQYLVIVPDADLIGVRQIAPRDDYHSSMSYEDFRDRMLVLAKALRAAQDQPTSNPVTATEQ